MRATAIIERFGGQSALARLIGKGQSTVAYWAKSGVIPSKWVPTLIELANDRNLNLSASDFFDGPKGPKPIVIEATASAQGASTAEFASETPATSQFLFYAAANGPMKVQVLVRSDTVWTTQRGMADIFGVDVSTINYHLKNIYKDNELDEATIGRFPIVQQEGDRTVQRSAVEFYDLDAIISVGYRVNSHQATQFRRWATTILREYLIKGFALDDARLKQGGKLFDRDYFDELLDRIRAIRASEKQFYKKITDLYSQCSVDYDPHAPITHHFYAHVQDKLHFAVHGHTSSELIKLRANASLPNMSLQTFEGERVTKADTKVGKNYLNYQESGDLNRLVTMYLDFAENLVRRNRASGTPMRMQDWVEKLDSFLVFNGFTVLSTYGSIKRDKAEQHALAEYEKYRLSRLDERSSDFEKISETIRTDRKLPAEPTP